MPMSPRLLRPRAASGFDPRSIAGLSMWLDAADRSTVLNSVSPDAQAATGQTVRRWVGKSGSGFNADQTTGVNQPVLSSSGITFDGVNDKLDFSSTALGVLRNRSYAACFACYSWASLPTAAAGVFTFSRDINSASRLAIFGGLTSGKLSMAARRLDSEGAIVATSSSDAPTSAFIHSAIANFSAATLTQRINGVVDGTGTLPSAGSTSDTDSALARIGQAAAFAGDPAVTNQPAAITMREILVYTSALSSSQVSTIERYLAARHGVSIT